MIMLEKNLLNNWFLGHDGLISSIKVAWWDIRHILAISTYTSVGITGVE